jgi:hypothetical protein
MDDIDPCYRAVREFQERFIEQFGTLSCLELTGVHLGTSEGQLEFQAQDQIKKCTDYVGEATRMVVEIVDLKYGHDSTFQPG